MDTIDYTNTAIVFVESGLFARAGVEKLQAQKKPIIKVKANVDGKDVEIALYFKMVYDETAGRFTDEYKLTKNGAKMLRGKVEDPYVANETVDPQQEEFDDEVPF